MADLFKREENDAVLTAELARLSRADAEVLNRVTPHAGARPKGLELRRVSGSRQAAVLRNHALPSSTRTRAAVRGSGKGLWRVGQACRRPFRVSRLRSHRRFAQPDLPDLLVGRLLRASSISRWWMGTRRSRAPTPTRGPRLQKAMLEGVINSETQRFRVDPAHSYVPKETRAQDPAFWMPKKPAAPKPTAQ